jgi:hypothetical protein
VNSPFPGPARIARAHIAASALLGFLAACGVEPSGDTCDDATCLTPPAAFCNGESRVSFALFGACSDGGCVYPPSEQACEFGCADGACREACDGVTCDAPPARCEGDVLVTEDVDVSTLESRFELSGQRLRVPVCQN